MKLGVPDNPNSKAGKLFDPNYLLCYHEGLENVIDLLKGATIEEHFQLPEEVVTSGPEYERIKAHADLARSGGLNLMMHSPFLHNKNQVGEEEKQLNMDFLWLESASQYKSMKLPWGVEIGQRKMDDATLERTLELSDKLGIPRVTWHFTKPGTFYTPEELVSYEKRIEQMQRIIQTNGYNSVPCLETGGIDPENHARIVRNQGVRMNFDTMHFMLDLEHLMPDNEYKSFEEAQLARDQRALQFYHDNKDIIANFHFTQTLPGQDLHKGIFEDGFSRINELVLRELDSELRSGERTELFAMVESAFYIRNFIYLDSVLRGDVVMSPQASGKYVTLFTGLPATGCSESLDACNSIWGTVFQQSDLNYGIESDTIKREYDENPHTSSINLADDNIFPQEFRRFMYDTVYKGIITRRLDQGNGVAFAASFNLADVRQDYYDLFDEKGAKDVYIIEHVSDERDIESRLNARAKAKKVLGNQATCVMSDMQTYRTMQSESTQFSPDEVAGRSNYHVAVYNTSTNQIQLHNPNQRLEHIAYVLRTNAEQKFRS
jgi:hypothetical protein